jgi:hypothetical protein
VASATTDVRVAAAPISDPVDAELARLRYRPDGDLLVLAAGPEVAHVGGRAGREGALP